MTLAHFKKATIYNDTRQFSKALTAANEALKIDSNHVGALGEALLARYGLGRISARTLLHSKELMARIKALFPEIK